MWWWQWWVGEVSWWVLTSIASKFDHLIIYSNQIQSTHFFSLVSSKLPSFSSFCSSWVLWLVGWGAVSSIEMASSLSSKPFLGASRTDGLSGLCSISSDLRNLSSPSVQFLIRPRTLRKLRKSLSLIVQIICFCF